MATDPVCGMYVEESPGALHATVNGRTYYFCAESCLQTFIAPALELRSLKRNIMLSVGLGVPILVLSYVALLPASFPTGWLLLAMATPVQFIAGRRFYQGTWNAIKMRSSNMDFLIAVGTSAAYFYSLVYVLLPAQFPFGGLYFDTSSVIVALILIGRLLEQTVKVRATDAIRKLSELQPRTATVVRADGKEEEIPVERVEVGDVFLVKPGERIATDGTVIEGHSSVDEKMVSGESLPVEKSEGSAVIGATINGSGVLRVRATHVGADTALSKIIQIVQDAQNTKAPVERLVNTIAAYFVPMVVAVALVSFVLWMVVGGKPVSFAFTAAVAVLVIACPCALGLATPAAIAVGAGKGAENGILIKGGEYLERTQKIDTVVFDKTGTLTRGEPEVTDMLSIGVRDDEVLKLAAVAERDSEHPLASAILRRYALEFPGSAVPTPEKFEAVPGLGIRATFSGGDLIFGSEPLLRESGVSMDGELARVDGLRNQGKTVMLLARNKALIGIVAVADTVKPSSKEAITGLKKMGLEPIMISGDNSGTTRAIAEQLGIGRYFAEVLPVQKSEIIRRLQEEEHRKVAMVGDGVNDAPALAQADVGIAIGSGSDIAVETGGMILMRDDLRDVVAGIQLSRRTMAKVKQNLFWAFAYNVALIPVAAGVLYLLIGVLLNPIISGAAMAMSSVTVVTNSLSLRRFRPRL
ncbi:MAG: heavy metal translocating P-type ATPase [Nitrososphaerota archaeon]|nr:heavy metal translocating P-type ATPase [Nitrososphaerota archaeon]MDG7023584.1 heavy metal translocating P-type ATPase [Nitrososphaerota archaeon]